MRTSILINSSGTNLNPIQNLIPSSPITGDADSTLYFCQISIECFTAIITEPNGLIVPDTTTKVTNGLSGTLTFNIYPSEFAPYPVSITPSNQINIATDVFLQWSGVVEKITVVASAISGCNYIRLLLDRN